MTTKKLIIFKALIATLVIGFLFLCAAKKTFIYQQTREYRDFIKNNEQHQKPISRIELRNQLRRAADYLDAHPSGRTAEDLREKIIQELNIDFLLPGLKQRELVVTSTAVRRYEEYTENELLFKDPQVGTFPVLFLIPNKKKESYPAILGLHGHGDSCQAFRFNEHFGKELAKEGFVVIIPTFRAMNCDRIEQTISKELYLKGFTLMGLRVYETHLLTKYLKSKDFVDEHKIGIMGHSGGSTVTLLFSRINSAPHAVVYDHFPNLLGLCGKKFHCETIPGLAYHAPQIKDLSTLKIPSRKFEYGYPGQSDMPEVIDFFKGKLVAQ